MKSGAIKALAVVGVGAFVTLGALSAAYAGVEPGRPLAGAGHEANPLPTQPTVGGMQFGGTATMTTPPNQPPVTKAAPLVRAPKAA